MSCSCKKKCTTATCNCLEYDLLCTDLCKCTNCLNIEKIDTGIESLISNDGNETDYDDYESDDDENI